MKYTTIKNDFCIIFDRNSDIIEVAEDSSIQDKGYSFISIKDISEMNDQVLRYRIVDIIGVIHYVGAEAEVNTKQGLCKKKRMISITDECGLFV